MRIPAPFFDMPLARPVPEIRNHSESLIKSSTPGLSTLRCTKSKPNPASQNHSPDYKSYLNMWAFPKIGQFFSQTFVGRSVGTSRICRVKKDSKSYRPRINRFPKNPYTCTLSVRRTFPFEPGGLLKLDNILAFSSALTIMIVHFSG